MSQKTDHEQAKSKLAQRYFDALQHANLENIYTVDHHSGVFLPTPHESFFSGSTKVFIVGQETRGWRTKECEARLQQKISLDGVLDSMENALAFNLKKPKQSKFRQFYKSASSKLCTDSRSSNNAALWSNQFCISYKKKDATKSPRLEDIRQLSFQILRAQFEVLKPDIAIFTTGHSRDKFLKQCFPCETVQVHEPKRLWEFMIGDTHCFRTNHPRWGGSNYFLSEAVKHAKICA